MVGATGRLCWSGTDKICEAALMSSGRRLIEHNRLRYCWWSVFRWPTRVCRCAIAFSTSWISVSVVLATSLASRWKLVPVEWWELHRGGSGNGLSNAWIEDSAQAVHGWSWMIIMKEL
ncbi:hypothetical protein BDV98DRAFT_577414 [Pterulicium gracile]|uniref:Uncharacterized protein n=1 Tax=Pterulicium gracile TaxID=1884261 RepID=A0A5C3Q1F0_9AGAR|nr:hypothetical protein BDV98DRAFT_577414 [Pterula gracilis]